MLKLNPADIAALAGMIAGGQVESIDLGAGWTQAEAAQLAAALGAAMEGGGPPAAPWILPAAPPPALPQLRAPMIPPLLYNPPLPWMIPSKAIEAHPAGGFVVDLGGSMQTAPIELEEGQAPEWWRSLATRPTLAQAIALASGQDVTRAGGGPFLMEGAPIGREFDIAWMEAAQRAPDLEFLEGIPADLGRILGRKVSKKRGTVAQVTAKSPDFESWASLIGKRTREEIEQRSGYDSLEDFYFDARRLLGDPRAYYRPNPRRGREQIELSLPFSLQPGRLPKEEAPRAQPRQKKAAGQASLFGGPPAQEKAAPAYRGDPRFAPLPGQLGFAEQAALLQQAGVETLAAPAPSKRAIQRAQRKKRAAEKKFPLLAQAGLLEEPSAQEEEELIQRFQEMGREAAARRVQQEEEQAQEAAALRAQVEALADPADLAQLEQLAPKTSAPYILTDYWRKQLDYITGAKARPLTREEERAKMRELIQSPRALGRLVQELFDELNFMGGLEHQAILNEFKAAMQSGELTLEALADLIGRSIEAGAYQGNYSLQIELEGFRKAAQELAQERRPAKKPAGAVQEKKRGPAQAALFGAAAGTRASMPARGQGSLFNPAYERYYNPNIREGLTRFQSEAVDRIIRYLQGRGWEQAFTADDISLGTVGTKLRPTTFRKLAEAGYLTPLGEGAYTIAIAQPVGWKGQHAAQLEEEARGWLRAAQATVEAARNLRHDPLSYEQLDEDGKLYVTTRLGAALNKLRGVQARINKGRYQEAISKAQEVQEAAKEALYKLPQPPRQQVLAPPSPEAELALEMLREEGPTAEVLEYLAEQPRAIAEEMKSRGRPRKIRSARAQEALLRAKRAIGAEEQEQGELFRQRGAGGGRVSPREGVTGALFTGPAGYERSYPSPSAARRARQGSLFNPAYARYYNPAYTSAATARPQVPALFKAVQWEPGDVNLDLGAGPYEQGSAYLEGLGVENIAFDPYHRSSEENRAAMSRVKSLGGADTVTAANLLNVVKSPADREAIYKKTAGALNRGGVAFFSVYQGDKSGKGRPTGPDSWQANRRASSYMPELRKHFHQVERKGPILIASYPKRKQNPIQSILIPKEGYTKGEARAWVQSQGFRAPAADEGGPAAKYYRYRQLEPGEFSRLRTMKIPGGEGIKAVVGPLKENPGPIAWPQARLFNPPVRMIVEGVRPDPITALIETTTGQVLEAPGFEIMEGATSGSGAQAVAVEAAERELARIKDFKSAKEAWNQFYNFNAALAGELVEARGPAVGRILEDPDSSGVRFEGITSYYERPRPIRSLEEAVKYIVNKEKIRRWDEFPFWMIREIFDHDWLTLPDPASIHSPDVLEQLGQLEGWAGGVDESMLAEAEQAGRVNFDRVWRLRQIMELLKREMSKEDYEGLLDSWHGLLEVAQAGGPLDAPLFDSYLEAIERAAGIERGPFPRGAQLEQAEMAQALGLSVEALQAVEEQEPAPAMEATTIEPRPSLAGPSLQEQTQAALDRLVSIMEQLRPLVDEAAEKGYTRQALALARVSDSARNLALNIDQGLDPLPLLLPEIDDVEERAAEVVAQTAEEFSAGESFARAALPEAEETYKRELLQKFEARRAELEGLLRDSDQEAQNLAAQGWESMVDYADYDVAKEIAQEALQKTAGAGVTTERLEDLLGVYDEALSQMERSFDVMSQANEDDVRGLAFEQATFAEREAMLREALNTAAMLNAEIEKIMMSEGPHPTGWGWGHIPASISQDVDEGPEVVAAARDTTADFQDYNRIWLLGTLERIEGARRWLDKARQMRGARPVAQAEAYKEEAGTQFDEGWQRVERLSRELDVFDDVIPYDRLEWLSRRLSDTPPDRADLDFEKDFLADLYQEAIEAAPLGSAAFRPGDATVLTPGGEYRQVSGYEQKGLVVHPAVKGQGWGVTHASSGGSIGKWATEEEAKIAAARLASVVPWTSDVGQISANEPARWAKMRDLLAVLTEDPLAQIPPDLLWMGAAQPPKWIEPQGAPLPMEEGIPF